MSSLKLAEVTCVMQVVKVLFLVLRAEPAGVGNEDARPVNENRNVYIGTLLGSLLIIIH